MKLTASSDFRLQSRDIQQRKLRLPPFEQHGVAFSLVVAEGDILPVDVPVARLQLSDQRAFGYLSAPQKPVWSDIVGKRGKRLSFPNCRNIAQKFRMSFRRSASACRFVMVRAEYLSPGSKRCPYPTYGWCFSECQPSKYFVQRTALSKSGSR